MGDSMMRRSDLYSFTLASSIVWVLMKKVPVSVGVRDGSERPGTDGFGDRSAVRIIDKTHAHVYVGPHLRRQGGYSYRNTAVDMHVKTVFRCHSCFTCPSIIRHCCYDMVSHLAEGKARESDKNHMRL